MAQKFTFLLDILIFFSKIVEDAERNDGTTERPYFMSERLMEMAANKNGLGSSN